MRLRASFTNDVVIEITVPSLKWQEQYHVNASEYLKELLRMDGDLWVVDDRGGIVNLSAAVYIRVLDTSPDATTTPGA